MPKYDISVELFDGNAFSIIAQVRKALRRHGVPELTITDYINDATSGDYDHLLTVSAEWVNLELPGNDLDDELNRDDDSYEDENDEYD